MRCKVGLEAVLDLYKALSFKDATLLLNQGRVGAHRAHSSSGDSRASKAVHVYGSATQPGRRVAANKGCNSATKEETGGAQGVHEPESQSSRATRTDEHFPEFSYEGQEWEGRGEVRRRERARDANWRTKG